MRAVLGLLMSMSILAGGCFPHNAKKRFYAELAEGATIATSILILSQAKTSADCDFNVKPGTDTSDCKSRANLIGNIGFGVMLAGLVGFIATVSSAEDDADNEPPKAATVLTPTKPGPAQPMKSPASPDPAK